ncbi:MAG: 6-phosphogluconolactonase [Bacteroidota bacterium]|nr:6-phosphogluconolactonase [Bacteroidota bacterium]
MKNKLHIFKTPEELANEFANQLMSWVETHSGNKFHLAISGGKTPDLLFDILAKKYADSVLWQKVHFWWVDERMVSPEHQESNFGTVQKLLFSRIDIPEKNIHRIKGENEPEYEAVSYSTQIRENLTATNGWPVFDLIVLGMGDDGHTASIFPDQMELLVSEKVCEVANHPVSGQKRVTLTGQVINAAAKVIFLVVGQSKVDRLAEIFLHRKPAKLLPAAYIQPHGGQLEWYVDEAAAGQIGSELARR